MATRGEIREGIDAVLNSDLGYIEGDANAILDNLIHYLHSQGVVIKVEGELPKNPFDGEVAQYSNRPIDEEATLDEHVVICSSNSFEKSMSVMLRAGYTLTESLIEGE